MSTYLLHQIINIANSFDFEHMLKLLIKCKQILGVNSSRKPFQEDSSSKLLVLALTHKHIYSLLTLLYTQVRVK